MTDDRAMPGPGHFRWNAGGWFGGQLGGTAWMLIGAAVLLPAAPGVAACWLISFAAANAIGTWLWRRRDRIRPYPATQALLLTCVASGLASLVALHALSPGLRIDRPPGVRLADEPRYIPRLALMGCGLALTFHLLERRAIAARGGRARCGG